MQTDPQQSATSSPERSRDYVLVFYAQILVSEPAAIMWPVIGIVALIAVFLLGGLLAFKALGRWGMPTKLPPALSERAWPTDVHHDSDNDAQVAPTHTADKQSNNT